MAKDTVSTIMEPSPAPKLRQVHSHLVNFLVTGQSKYYKQDRERSILGQFQDCFNETDAKEEEIANIKEPVERDR